MIITSNTILQLPAESPLASRRVDGSLVTGTGLHLLKHSHVPHLPQLSLAGIGQGWNHHPPHWLECVQSFPKYPLVVNISSVRKYFSSDRQCMTPLERKIPVEIAVRLG